MKTSASSQTKPDALYEKVLKPDHLVKAEQYRYQNKLPPNKFQHEKINSLNNHIVIASIEDKFLGEELNMKLRGIKEKTRNAYYTLGLNKNTVNNTKENNLFDSYLNNKNKLFDTFDRPVKQTIFAKGPEEKNYKLFSESKDTVDKNSLLKTILNKNVGSSNICVNSDKPKFELSQFKSKFNGQKYVADNIITKEKSKIADSVVKGKISNKKYF